MHDRQIGGLLALENAAGAQEFLLRISPVKRKGPLGDAPRGLLLLRSSCVTSAANRGGMELRAND
jgi:hypothetical protein